jgi:hypothetical protein
MAFGTTLVHVTKTKTFIVFEEVITKPPQDDIFSGMRASPASEVFRAAMLALPML